MSSPPSDVIEEPVQQTEALPRFGPPTRANPLWRVVVVSGALFCVSCLLWITASYGDPRAPGNQWLNKNGLLLVAVTGVVAVGSSWTAMFVDTRQTRRMQTDAQTGASRP